MQVRLFRTKAGTFDMVMTPRRRTGLVPVMVKGVTKDDIPDHIEKLGRVELDIMNTIRGARASWPAQ